MKIASLLAGVAAIALTAGAASAQDINKGQVTLSGLGFPLGFLNGATVDVPVNVFGFSFGNNANLANANNGDATWSSWHAVGNAQNNIGSAATSDGATFTLTGAVSTDCAYYSGNNATETLDFGQIGIYASDETGPAAAFTMVAPATVSIDTNLAGCNTANTVKIQKNDLRGMVNNSGSGYDTDVFQANLPYQVTASYKASGTGAPAAGTNQSWTVATDVDQGSRTHGAWKSAMSLDVLVPQASKALLAGTYSGSFSVTISAGI